MTRTRLWQTGLELDSLSAEFNGIMGNATYINIVNTNYKTGAYCLRVGGSAYTYDAVGYKMLPSETYQTSVGFHMKSQDTQDFDVRIFTLRTTAGVEMFRLQVDNTGTFYSFYVWNEARQIQQVGSDISIDQNIYYHWGIDLKINASTGWCYVYKDGNLVASYDGDTDLTKIGRIDFGTYPELGDNNFLGGNYAYYDDIFIDDTTGETSANPVPDRRFSLLKPDNNGIDSEWNGSDGNQVDNYLLVDDIPHDSDTTYVVAATTDLKDSYNLESFSLPANSEIRAIIPVAVSKKGDDTDCKIALGLNVSASGEQIESGQNIPTSYGLCTFERFTTTSGGGDWTESDINNAQVIIQSEGTFT